MSQSDQLLLMLKNLTDFVKASFKSDQQNIRELGDKIETLTERIVTVEKQIISLEFKHNWKTAFWVFVGSAIPTIGGIVVFWFTFVR